MNSQTTLPSKFSPFSLQNSPQHVSAMIDTQLQHLLRISNSIILNKERNVNTLPFSPDPNKNHDKVRRETQLATIKRNLPKSISTVGWEAYANGGNRVDWPGLGPTGDAATAKGAPFTPNTLPLPLPCRDQFFTANNKKLDRQTETVLKLGFAGA